MLTLPELEPGLTVLDHPGADIPAMADAVTTDGRVVGVDIDPKVVEAANARFHDRPHVEIRLGDGHALPFETPPRQGADGPGPAARFSPQAVVTQRR
ncbi:methyltransferase domain-containing protein [Lentzea flava]|uniref:Methyltransferase domain-containing protein n=1 Tax=Lentzea flava TaxID=103732 RepID=A0ABQ2UIB2_9PSEU|nr:methyltransferase domain-containing protein [Lentzea flava]MCP2198856.1 Methyltransferase domain-containing protein [Lentzea flava]GGU30599.1 hypothetical protein GCM10010178_23660 [Lentzea flava]